MKWTIRATTEAVIVHCSATATGVDIGAEDIRAWHKARGWSDIGYHFVIRRDGTLEFGRPSFAQGAHARGANAWSIGVCIVGGKDGRDNFTWEQMDALKRTLHGLLIAYPTIKVITGHRSLPGVRKACPSFDVAAELATWSIADRRKEGQPDWVALGTQSNLSGIIN